MKEHGACCKCNLAPCTLHLSYAESGRLIGNSAARSNRSLPRGISFVAEKDGARKRCPISTEKVGASFLLVLFVSLCLHPMDAAGDFVKTWSAILWKDGFFLKLCDDLTA